MRKVTLLFILGIFIVSAISCSEEKSYSPEVNVKHKTIDSLIVDMVTFIGKRPKGALQGDRFNPDHRKWYESIAGQFELIYYFVNEEEEHFYYMIRPARNQTGSVNRGVGGHFRIDDSSRIFNFHEVFNTPILPVDELKTKGMLLFEEMLATGGIDRWIGNKEYIEWPDARTRYDADIYEWIYISD